MTYIYTPYIWPFIGTIIMNLLMILYILKNRCSNGGTAFIITLLFSSLWCVGTAMEISAADLASNIFWAKIGFSAYTFGPVAFLIMVLQITDLGQWTNRKKILLLCIIPVITVMLVLTNDFHRLIWQHFS